MHIAQEFYKEILDEEGFISARRAELKKQAGLGHKDVRVTWYTCVPTTMCLTELENQYWSIYRFDILLARVPSIA